MDRLQISAVRLIGIEGLTIDHHQCEMIGIATDEMDLDLAMADLEVVRVITTAVGRGEMISGQTATVETMGGQDEVDVERWALGVRLQLTLALAFVCTYRFVCLHNDTCKCYIAPEHDFTWF